MAVSTTDAPLSLATAPNDTAPITVIEPARGWMPLDWGELWRYRELLYFLVWRDIKVRYKQTVLGLAWAVLQPVLTMVAFTLFFGRLAGVSSDGVPYSLFSFTGLVPWTFFTYGLAQSSASVVSSQALIGKIYFPRILLPTATVLSGLVDFVIALAVLGIMLMYYQVPIAARALWLVPLSLLTFVTSLGVGLWLSALNVKYRDVRYLVPFLTQLWLFATPIAYSSTLLSDRCHTIYALNPMVGVVEGFRWSMLGVGHGPGSVMLVSTLVAVVVLVSGAAYFQRTEVAFADIV